MPKTRRGIVPVALAILLGLTSSSCLYTKRVIPRHNKERVTAATAPTLLTATRDELGKRIATFYNAINSFQATVDMTPSIGSVYTSSITEIKDVRAHVYFRKPSEIRILGQAPVIREYSVRHAFGWEQLQSFAATEEPVFRGQQLCARHVEKQAGKSSAGSFPVVHADPLRWTHATESTALVDATDEDNALYILYFARVGPKGEFLGIARGVWFDRIDLSIVRQTVYDESGSLISDTRYSKWMSYAGVQFPAHIDINRDKDGYGVVLDIGEMQMNVNIPDMDFVLNQPEGYQLRTVGESKITCFSSWSWENILLPVCCGLC